MPAPWYYPCLGLLGIRIILDCADGQLARLSGQTSSLGKLYDLVSDFQFLVVSALALSVFGIRQGQSPGFVILLSLAGLLAGAVSTAMHSFYDLMLRTPETELSQAADRFARPPDNDRPLDKGYAAKLRLFSRLFEMSWGSVSRMVVSFARRRQRIVFRRVFMLLLAPVEYGIQITVLLAMTGMQVEPTRYFIYQIGCLIYAGLLVAIFGRGERSAVLPVDAEM